MKLSDTLWLGSKGLRERKVRATITIISVVISVASIIGLVSQTAGIQESIVGALQGLGPTTLLITPQSVQLTQSDISKILSIPNVQTVIPLVTARMTITQSAQNVPLTLIGVDSEGLQSLLGQVTLVGGQVYPPTSAPLAVVGNSLAFPVALGQAQAIYVGEQLILQQQFGQSSRKFDVQVIGLLDKYSANPFVPADNSVFLPLDASMRLLNRHNYDLLLVRATNVDSVSGVSQFLTEVYGTSAQIQTVQAITQTVSSVIGQFGILLGAIAAISLTVAGLGIMNIMLVSVFERTKEIGILKAIGFKDREILSLFLSEAAIVGVAGGIIGLLAGWGVSNLLPLVFEGLLSGRGSAQAPARGGGGMAFAIPSYSPVITPDIVSISFIIALLVSVAAGLYPALRAARMHPIKALRYE